MRAAQRQPVIKAQSIPTLEKKSFAPTRLVHPQRVTAGCEPGTTLVPAPQKTHMLFTELGLAEPLLRAVKEQGYDTPTPIQAQAIPQVLKGGEIGRASCRERV